MSYQLNNIMETINVDQINPQIVFDALSQWNGIKESVEDGPVKAYMTSLLMHACESVWK
jgi:hypothetical protein